MIFSIRNLSLALCLITVSSSQCSAFSTSCGVHSRPMTATTTITTMSLRAENKDNSNNNEATTTTTNRRDALFGIMAATVGGATSALMGNPQEASARYSSYAHREQDWEERNNKGQVNYKTAKDLRAELRDIVPQNNANSKIFCPNGPSAAVSPLMENKCGDRMAIPSVYGRTEDTVGNSIPGFATSYKSADIGKNAGGFPNYK